MKNRILAGLSCGFAAGLLDIIPMIAQKLTWDASLSALSMWTVIGLLVAVTDIKINGPVKGILLSFLVLLPSAILIGRHDPVSLVPIAAMTLILGAALGFAINKLVK